MQWFSGSWKAWCLASPYSPSLEAALVFMSLSSACSGFGLVGRLGGSVGIDWVPITVHQMYFVTLYIEFEGNQFSSVTTNEAYTLHLDCFLRIDRLVYV